MGTEALPGPGAQYQVVVQWYDRGGGDPRERLPVLGADRVGKGWRFRCSSSVAHRLHLLVSPVTSRSRSALRTTADNRKASPVPSLIRPSCEV